MKNNLSILICDDSAMIRKKLIHSIKDAYECTIYEAKNGHEAIGLYEKESPDIVFMDIIMPEVDGIKALRNIIKYDVHAKVIMLTSVGTKKNLKFALEIGAKDFIQKPWDIINLKSVISKYIKE